MRHRREGRKLKRTSSHRKALLRSLAMQLFEYKKIHTTEAKAKELRPFAESLITRAKKALANENQGNLPEGQSVDIHARRVVAKDIKKDEVLRELFDAIAPATEDRNGGYTRIVKTGFRRGDAGSMAIIELVDFAEDADPRFAKKKSSAKASTKKVQSDIDTFDDIDKTIEESKKDQAKETSQEGDNQTESNSIDNQNIETSEPEADKKQGNEATENEVSEEKNENVTLEDSNSDEAKSSDNQADGEISEEKKD